MSDPDDLILETATGKRQLTEDELGKVLEHVAQAGFDPNALERVRGRLAGVEWQGKLLKGRDMLSPAEVHYLWHVIVNKEWPLMTTLQGYLSSIREVILDQASYIFASRYQGVWQLGILGPSGNLRGPGGYDWVMVEYRVEVRHWVTAFQPKEGLGELQSVQRSDLTWLRQS